MEEMLGLVKRFEQIRAGLEEIIACASEINKYNLNNGLSREINDYTVRIKSIATALANSFDFIKIKEKCMAFEGLSEKLRPRLKAEEQPPLPSPMSEPPCAKCVWRSLKRMSAIRWQRISPPPHRKGNRLKGNGKPYSRADGCKIVYEESRL